ncbi:hypothetical protein HAX54_006946, partial [Datura stramonium]|nr:hypothetical protein [Datura stramonium]
MTRPPAPIDIGLDAPPQIDIGSNPQPRPKIRSQLETRASYKLVLGDKSRVSSL